MLFRRKRHLTGIADVERDTTDVMSILLNVAARMMRTSLPYTDKRSAIYEACNLVAAPLPWRM